LRIQTCGAHFHYQKCDRGGEQQNCFEREPPAVKKTGFEIGLSQKPADEDERMPRDHSH
jgi:hypothetical protein